MLKKRLHPDISIFMLVNLLKIGVDNGGERWLKVGYCGKLRVLNC